MTLELRVVFGLKKFSMQHLASMHLSEKCTLLSVTMLRMTGCVGKLQVLFFEKFTSTTAKQVEGVASPIAVMVVFRVL